MKSQILKFFTKYSIFRLADMFKILDVNKLLSNKSHPTQTHIIVVIIKI